MLEPDRLAKGELFADRYEIVGRLGGGGMGAVYAARNVATNRAVAVKLLHSGVGRSAETRARFAAEARAPAAIDSPHIVEVLDAGVDAKTEAPFLVMELLDGETLEKRVAREQHLDPAQVVTIVRQIASALDRAHERGIVHRDIKPDNIFLSRAGDGTIVKILDFGIAKTDEGAQTVAGAILGTPLYMSPEQVDAHVATHLVDVWSLGLVVYFALVGRPYWRADGVANLLRQIIGGPKHKPVAQAAAAGVLLPGAFDAWFERCVAHDPRARFPSAGEATAALAEALGVDGDVAIAPVPETERSYTRRSLDEGRQKKRAHTSSSAGSSSTKVAAKPAPVGSKSPTSALDPTRAAPKLEVAPDPPAPAPPVVARAAPPVALAAPAAHTDQAGAGAPSTLEEQPRPEVRLGALGGGSEPPWDEEAGDRAGAVASRGAERAEPAPNGWASLSSVLPAGLAPHGGTIASFLRALFTGLEPIDAGIVRLVGPRMEGGATRDFFAVFMGEGDRGDRRMLTATFLGYVDPLAAHLERLDASRRKVVFAIVDSLELGAGVHHTIFEFNERFAAMVLPLHVGDLAGAVDDGDAAALFRARLSDFHVFPDVFGAGGRTAASRFGTRATVNDLTSILRGRSPFVVAYGPPGSGKTSLVDTVAGELAHKAFVRVRCSIGTPSVTALVRRIGAALDGDAERAERDERDDAGSIAERLTAAIDRAGARRSVVLVLDDADWPVRALLDASIDPAELALVHELWATLSEAVDAAKLAVIVVGTSAFLLLKALHRGWSNPIANQARRVDLEPLVFADLRKMMTDLGAQVNARFEDGAIAEVYAQSGGNVHVSRLLCRRVVVPMRSSAQVTPLHEIVVARADVRRAAGALAETPDTFTDAMIASLDAPEQLVLKVIADARPRTVARIWRALEGRCTSAACSEALERLLKMRFVEWTDGRARVAIPLFERWARLHLEPIEREAARVRAARLRYAAIGATLTFVLVAGYFVSTAEESLTWSTASCRYLAAYPSRAAPETPFTLRLVRQCAADESAPLALYPGPDTSVRFDDGAPGAASVSTYPLVKRGAGRDAAWDNEQVRVTFQDMNRGTFFVDVRPTAPPVELVIQKDFIGNLSAFVKGLLALASAAPALVGLFLAFHEQVRSTVRRIAGERDAAPRAGG